MNKVVVLGLDGATFDVLDPLMARGKLPNLARIKQQGVYGDLESTFPPITAPAWLSLATGKNPGRTGVFYFLYRDKENFEFKPLGAQKFYGHSFWDYLSRADRRVGILHYPMLYPPYPINGFMVSGILSPEDDSITSPAGLKAELDAAAGGYRIKVNYADPQYRRREKHLFHELMQILEKRTQALLYLIQNRPTDLLFAVFSATDWAQHYFWKFWDDSHNHHDPRRAREGRRYFEQIWEKVDEIVGRIRDAIDPGTDLILVSDHGFGPVDQTFYVNTWLRQQGYLVRRQNKSVTTAFRKGLYGPLEKMGGWLLSRLPALTPWARRLGHALKPQPADWIDFERSRAFALRQNLTCGMIYLNVPDPDQFESLRREIANRLTELPRQLDMPFAIEVYNREDLYHGECVHLAPALFFKINNFRCAVDPRYSRELIASRSPMSGRSGGHRLNGILMGLGPHLGRGAIPNARIVDIAPSLLHLMDCPVPPDMDGRILPNLFPPTAAPSPAPACTELHPSPDENTLSRDDTNQVRQRLEALGYL